MASFAIDKSSNGKFKYSTNALIKDTTIVEEDPKPEPGGLNNMWKFQWVISCYCCN